MSVALRSVSGVRYMIAARHYTGSVYDHGNIRTVPGFKKPPVPHEDLLIENDGRYPPHLKIDMDHPENWPKHFPPFYESRRPAKWPLSRAVVLGFVVFQALLLWTNPTWLTPWIVEGFPCFRKDTNWVKLEEHEASEQLYPWTKPLIDPENRSDAARRALGYNVICESEEDLMNN